MVSGDSGAVSHPPWRSRLANWVRCVFSYKLPVLASLSHAWRLEHLSLPNKSTNLHDTPCRPPLVHPTGVNPLVLIPSLPIESILRQPLEDKPGQCPRIWTWLLHKTLQSHASCKWRFVRCCPSWECVIAGLSFPVRYVPTAVPGPSAKLAGSGAGEMWHRRHDLHPIRPQPPAAWQLWLWSAGPGMRFFFFSSIYWVYPDL